MRTTTTILLALCLSLPAMAAPLQQAKTKEGYRYGWLGPLPKKPMPTVLFLGGYIEWNLTDTVIHEGVEQMCKKVLCLTIDNPGEGEADWGETNKKAAMSYWADSLANNKDFLGKFISRANVVLDKLANDGVVDRSRVGIFGTSRGAFISLHLAASGPKFRAVAVFAPVTDLTVPYEFIVAKEAARKFTAASHAKFAEKLYRTPIWLSIGTNDERVGTQEAIYFSQLMMRASDKHGVPSPFELHVKPADGHRTPDRGYVEASQWMLRQLANTPTKPHAQ